MGRSHNWNRPIEMDRQLFHLAVEDVRRIMPELRKREPKLTGIEGRRKPVVEDFGIFFTVEPAEWFTLACIYHFPHRVRPGETRKWEYVKTYGKPGYDLAVVSTLLVFKHHFGTEFKLGSDFGMETLRPAMDLVREILGYTEEWNFVEREEDGMTERTLEVA